MSDIAIIGGGPAGTAAAIALRCRGRDVLIVERSRYDEMRIGESVPPPAIQMLRELGVADELWTRDAIPCHGIWSAWGEEEVFERSFIFHPYGHGWHVDRRKLDARLAAEAERHGAELLCETKLIACEWCGDHWRLTLERDSRTEMRTASFLIDASGRSSILATMFGVRRVAYDRLIAVAQLFDDDGESLPVTLVESVENGWWYSAPLPGGALLAVYLTDADLHPPSGRDAVQLPQLLDAARYTSARTAGRAPHGPPRTMMADTYRAPWPKDARWINTGAAAVGVDPLSSDGICFALRSGCEAAMSADRHLRGDVNALDAYARSLDQYFEGYLAERAQFYAAEGRWEDRLFWLRRSSG
jgi:flavin-dependent dehydrogenase